MVPAETIFRIQQFEYIPRNYYYKRFSFENSLFFPSFSLNKLFWNTPMGCLYDMYSFNKVEFSLGNIEISYLRGLMEFLILDFESHSIDYTSNSLEGKMWIELVVNKSVINVLLSKIFSWEQLQIPKVSVIKLISYKTVLFTLDIFSLFLKICIQKLFA